MSEQTAPETAEAPPTGRVGWRRVLLLLFLLGAGVVILSHRLGGRVTGEAGLGALAAGGAVLVLWRYPHLRRHFAPFGPRHRRRQYRERTSSRTWGSPGFSGRRAGGKPGSPFSRAGRGGSRSGSGTGRRGGLGSMFRRAGKSGGKGGGKALNYPGQRGQLFRGKGKSKGKGAAGARSGGKSGSARKSPVAKARRGSGGSRRGSGAFPKFRRGSGTSRRGGLIPRRPAGSRPGGRKPAGTGGRRGGLISGSRRKSFRPWRRRTAPGLKPRTGPRATGGPGTGSRTGPKPRRWFAPWRGRSRTRPGRQSPGRPVKPRRTRPGFWASAGFGLAYARWRAGSTRAGGRYRSWRAGAPGRRMARQARRARGRAWQVKLNRVNPLRRRWYAPWRRSHVPAWRFRGRKLTWRARIARRWNIRRGKHSGLSRRRVRRPARVVLRSWRRRLGPRRAWARFRRHRRRTAGVPRPWAQRGKRYQRQVARFDQWRRDRFRRRFRRHRPAAAPASAPPGHPAGPPAPAKPVVLPSGRGVPPDENRTTGGTGMADVQSIADAIEELGGWDAEDPDQIHTTLTNLHRVIGSTQSALQRIGDKLPETGVKDSYAEAVNEAAAALGGIADQLESVIGGGVVQS